MIVKSEKKSVAKKRHLYSGEKGERYFLKEDISVRRKVDWVGLEKDPSVRAQSSEEA